MLKKALEEHDVTILKNIGKYINKPNLNHIPLAKGLPILGNLIQFRTDVRGFLTKNFQEHGSLLRVKVFNFEVVFLRGPDANQLVLKNQDKIFSNYVAWHKLFEGVFDNALLERDFGNHKYQRKILQQAFKRDLIEGYVNLMSPEIVKSFSSWPTKAKLQFMPSIKKNLLGVASKIFLGVNAEKDIDKLSKAFTDMVHSTTDLIRIDLPFTPYRKGKQGKKVLSDFIFKQIDAKRNSNDADFLTKVCQLTNDDGELFTDSEIRDQINFLVFAAHDTTTSTLSSLMYSLADNIEWQEKLREEINRLNTEHPTIDDLEKMELCSLAFKETLRMYPPLPIFFRFALEEFEFEGTRIPAHTPLAISPVHSHYMPEYWTNPEQFDPERFSPERAEDKQHLYQWVAFGGGAHKCLGLYFAELQVKLVVFHLIKNFKITKEPNSTFNFNHIPLTFPTDGLPLNFERINL